MVCACDIWGGGAERFDVELPRGGSNLLFNRIDLYWHSSEFGGVWYQPRQLKQKVCSPSGDVGGKGDGRVDEEPQVQADDREPHARP